ncbi:SSS family solute:Na+ symporter [Chromobacterium alkanivorans]|uniref:sodium:solute symporter n=1 Tax=Chromobacterium alkanivorans TaxID=1071719 RepID=UPI0021693E3C|nr:sodium:solute symporter [Chromobacterium alkanivorans]MCS3806133.1 SSS family solute:Na+ symporter [Chromobacterium alkanivorans]MCS3820465.1 SSS family solute:Na+ symporter [Chromobacterium alkanivorans]MCS3875223.1 SSS family solute:Na+ symporter [Chromobacterium alkanivorans]
MLIDYATILAYALAMAGLGWWGMRRARTRDDFLLAGRRLGPTLYLGTLSAVVLGGASTIGSVRLGYQYGISGLWLVLMLGLGVMTLSLAFSRQIARMRVFTVTQILEQRYRASSRLIGGVVMIGYDLMVAVTATIAIGSVTEVMFGLPRIPAILLGGGLVIFYSAIGGMWSLTLTDIVQFVIMTVGIFGVLLPLSVAGAGGLDAMRAGLPASFFELGAIGLDTIVAYFLLYFFGALIGQDIWQRLFTARSERVVRYAGLAAGGYCVCYGAACSLIGVAARRLLPELAVTENAFAELTRSLLPAGLRGLVAAAALAAIMSTASACLLAAATVLKEDVYSRFLRRGDQRHLAGSRWITLGLGLLMLLLSCLVNDVIAGLSIAYNLLVGGLLVPILGALLWRRASAQGAMAGMLLGSLTVVALMMLDGLTANTPIYYGLAANLLGFVGVSLMTAPAPSLSASK